MQANVGVEAGEFGVGASTPPTPVLRSQFMLALHCNLATSSMLAFQHASSNNIHSLNEQFVNRMQKVLRNSTPCLFSITVEFANWLKKFLFWF